MACRDKLNVLWILTDEQRTDSLGCYGSRWAHSPNLDALAARGTRFASCTVQSPVCVPSRTCLLTGRYAHAVGVLDNVHKPLPNETPLTWLFERAGYQVANFGKCGYADPQCRPFPISEGGPGYGASAASPFGLARPHDPKDHDVVFLPFECPWGDRIIVGGRYPLPPEQAEPGLLAARCEKFLREEVRPPFFLRVSIIAPHTPVLASAPFFGSTDPGAIDLPPVPPRDGRPECSRYDREVLGRVYDFNLLSAEEVRKARATYYDLCAQVDAAVGQMLACLEDTHLAEDTLVIFTSDHGDMLGEHGLGQKESFYDPVVQAPLIFACPTRLPAGRCMAEPVETIDLLPTALQLAGLEVPDNVHGLDLTASMRKGRGDPARIAFSEIDHAQSPVAAMRAGGGHRAMARTARWKLYYFLNDSGFGADGVLYDLAADAGETRNLYADPAHAPVVEHLQAAIRQWQERK